MLTAPVVRFGGMLVNCVSGNPAVGARLVHAREAGVGSAFPDASVARTSKRCAPVGGEAISNGELHPANAPPSTRQENAEPGSLLANENDTAPAGVSPDGPEVICVSGGVVSAGAGSGCGVGSGPGVGDGPPVPDVAGATVTFPAALQLLASRFSRTRPEASRHTRTANTPRAPDGTATLAVTDRRCPAESAGTAKAPNLTREPAAGFQSTPPELAPARAFPALRTTTSTRTDPSANADRADTTTRSARATTRRFAPIAPPATPATTTAASANSATTPQSLDRTPRITTTLSRERARTQAATQDRRLLDPFEETVQFAKATAQRSARSAD